MTRLRELIGAALRRRRLAEGRTLRQVAAKAGVSLTYLSEIERGRKEPSSEVLVAVCDALGLDLSDILYEVADAAAAQEAEEAAAEARLAAPVGFAPATRRLVPLTVPAAVPDGLPRNRPRTALPRIIQRPEPAPAAAPGTPPRNLHRFQLHRSA